MSKFVFDAINSIKEYYESIEDFIKTIPTGSKIQDLINKITSLSNKISKTTETVDHKFEYIHQYVLLSYLLNELYNLLDFEIPVTDDFSKTRSLRSGELFGKITKLYKTYIFDVAGHTEDYVKKFYNDLEASENLDVQKLNELWHKFPQSIQLYSMLINKYLDNSYKSKNFEKVNEILKILDENKYFILEEKEFISPYLFLGLSIYYNGNLQSDDKEGGESKTGKVIIKRNTTNNIIYNKPKKTELGTGKGISLEDIFRLYSPVENTKSLLWNWSIKIENPKAEKFEIIEFLTNKESRILVPFSKQSSPLVSRNEPLMERILSGKFGRPYAYYQILDNALINALDQRVSNLNVEDTQHEVVELGLNIMDITEIMSKNYSAKYIESDKILEDYEKHIFKVLEPYIEDAPMDLVILWIEKSKSEFKKELNLVNFDEDPKTKIHDLIAKVLNKKNNIFQDLIAKIHRLKLVEDNTKKSESDF